MLAMWIAGRAGSRVSISVSLPSFAPTHLGCFLSLITITHFPWDIVRDSHNSWKAPFCWWVGRSPLNSSLYCQGTHPWQLPAWISVHIGQRRSVLSDDFSPVIRLSGISVSPKKTVLKPLNCSVLRDLKYFRHCCFWATSEQPLGSTCRRSGFVKRCMPVCWFLKAHAGCLQRSQCARCPGVILQWNS